MDDSKDEYVKRVKKSALFEALIAEDPEFADEVANLLGTQAARERTGGLPVGTKQLLWVVVECAMKWDPATIKMHMRSALDHGYTPQQILEALEVAVPPTGFPSFIYGFNIWKEVVAERKT